MRTTSVDLCWWLDLAAGLDWTFARTYAESAPHSYVVHGRTAGMTEEDYVRAARVIHTFGSPGKFYGMTNLYLTSPDGRVKWWTMDTDVRNTTLINRASTERLYGVQNAPSTESGIETPYDEIATVYDELHPTSEVTANAVREGVGSLAGPYPPSVLDIGCGTGRVLDMGFTSPDRYAGVDPSKPMLNQLVQKHPNVGAVYPMTIERALADGCFTPGQFEVVTALLSQADLLDDASWAPLREIASRVLITVVGDQVTVIHARAGATASRAS